MAHDDELDDDYVVNLLIKDASNLSDRTSRRSALAPKPNTRFLKNIIREADGHNAALRRKEEREASHRRRQFDRDERRRDGLANHDAGRLTPPPDYIDNVEDDRKAKRRRLDDAKSSTNYGQRSLRRERSKDRLQKRDRGGDRVHRHHKRDRARSRSHERDREPRKRRQQSRSQEEGEHSRDKGQSKRDAKKDRRSHAPDYIYPRRCSRSPLRNKEPLEDARLSPSSISNVSSDPLEELVGPNPPSPVPKVRGRGRGTNVNSSVMDRHFGSRYNPSADVRPESDEEHDDWEQALEALRDRQKWQQMGAQRLRDAGFSEAEVKKWEKDKAVSNEDGDIEDVRWSKKGEDREWDRGKILDEDGVELKAEWSQLKGT